MTRRSVLHSVWEWPRGQIEVVLGTLNFATVRRLGLTLPDVVDGTAYGAPALKLRGKLLSCIPVNKSAEPDSVAVRIDLELRAELLRQHPDVYYVTDHYAPHPVVLVRLSRITRADLSQLLRDAYRFLMPSAVTCAVTAGRPKSDSHRRKASRKR